MTVKSLRGGCAGASHASRTWNRHDRYDLARHEPSIDVWTAKRILAGWTPQAIAAAGSISLRTAYRWTRDLLSLEEVTVDGWTAWFARRRSQPPKRISPWTQIVAAVAS